MELVVFVVPYKVIVLPSKDGSSRLVPPFFEELYLVTSHFKPQRHLHSTLQSKVPGFAGVSPSLQL